MKLGTKLLMAPLLTAFVALSAGQLNTWMTSREAEASQVDVHKRNDFSKELSQVSEQLAREHAGAYRTVALMASLDDAKVKAQRAALAQHLQKLQEDLKRAGEQAEADSQVQALLTSSIAQIGKYQQAADMAIDMASVDPNTGIAALQTADELFAALNKGMNDMLSEVDQQTDAARTASQARVARTSLLLTLLGLAAAAAAVGVAWQMQRKLVADLQRAARFADAVAAGDLRVVAQSDRQDEAGDLLRALDRMARQLNRSMQTVLGSSQSIETASAEIASGNLDLSNRTEVTASNLQQTASSMEQLTGTVRQSAEAAHTANELASNATEVALRGGTVVGQVVSTMDEINSSSKQIADIIGVIDSIAFQTNILALNAAVEAARAGEQGRGFAVVAGEVRALAQRSAGAAKEIKTLIDASVGKVEAGARLVQHAGRTMDEIVASVQRVTSIIADISAGTVGQTEGLGSINQAVAQLDQMTQQNAALVEQSAAAAASMREQAVTLAELVSSFKISQEGALQD